MLKRKRKYQDNLSSMDYKIQYIVNVNFEKNLEKSPEFTKKILSEDIRLSSLER